MPDQYLPLDRQNVLTRDGKIVTSSDQGTSTNPTNTIPVKGTCTRNRFAITGAAAATTVISANPKRISATLQNVGTTDLWVSSGAAATASIGFKLEAGKSLVDDVTTAAWSCFGASNGSLEVCETATP